MSDLSKRTDDELERALRSLGRAMPAANAVGLLDRVEAELTGTDARKRRINWRTLAVAAIALTVAGVGALLVWRAFGARSTGLSSPPSGGFHALWPETTWEAAVAAQERVDAGEDGWRSAAPEETALMFVKDVLGWTDPTVNDCSVANETRTTDPEVSCPADPDNARVYVRRSRAAFDFADEGAWMVDLARVVRSGEGGVWSVVAVSGGGVSIDVAPGAQVHLGSSVPATRVIEATAGESPYSLAAFVVSEGCAPRQGLAVWGDGEISLAMTGAPGCDGGSVPSDSQSSSGFLVGLVANGEAHPLKLGPSLFDFLDDPDMALLGLAMVPVELLPYAPEPPPSPQPTPTAIGEVYGSVWPELDESDMRATQARVDSGDEDVQWRTDPAVVATRVIEDSTDLEVRSAELTLLKKDGRRGYTVLTSNGSTAEVEVFQPLAHEDGAIWNVSHVLSRLDIRSVRVSQSGDHVIDGIGAPAGARIGYFVHRACPPEFPECGYDDVLRSVEADQDGAFHIEENFGAPPWTNQPGSLAVWIIEESGQMRFLDTTIIWLASEEF
ncbi:MAG: hypothetical protein LC722_06530 [Actinobacteria bacterium]|nr:hypothetical protein [Actinomycetota bacterium]